MKQVADAIIIGGGFYGVNIALYLAKIKGIKKVVLLEKESDLLSRASFNNQARVHNGYHYPRSFTTAYRSRVNLPRFVKDWSDAIYTEFTKIYAIARFNSKVTSKQFERFCNQIGAPLQPTPKHLEKIFNPRLIEKSFQVVEYAFNAKNLASWAKKSLGLANIDVRYHCLAESVQLQQVNNSTILELHGEMEGQPWSISAPYIFNCTYSGLNGIQGDFQSTHTLLKHEITEMGLMELPAELKNIGITVMDGAFFSVMPFPAKNLHTLSHVRYTPHMQWLDKSGESPYPVLANYHKESRVDRMVRDVRRYIPQMHFSSKKDSLFEIKTVLVKNEMDDGRPILFEEYAHLPGFYSVLGGKIDNIYDVLEKLDTIFQPQFHTN